MAFNDHLEINDSASDVRTLKLLDLPQEIPVRYRVGTLSYTQFGLVTLFIWLLWGDFCFNLMETVLPRLLPLKLKALGTSNATMGLLVGSIPGMMNMVITPLVSFKSDRYRGRLGRRIPFLLWPTPFIALFLIMLGFSEEIGQILNSLISGIIPSVSPLTVTLFAVGILMVMFQFFNMFVASVYYYLFNDVVPEQFLGRFMALFRMVGTAGGIIFNLFIFGHVETHMKEIFIGISLLYLVSFLLMCWRVKEGEYPPPPEKIEGPGWISGVKTYFTECFSNSYYIYFFLGTSFYTLAGTVGLFAVFFAQSIGLSLDQFGKIGGWLGIPSLLLLYPMGWIADRFHPLRVVLLATLILIPANLACFFFIHGWWSYLMLSVTILPLMVAYSAANLPMYMVLLPKERYGQFCSAQAMINALAIILGNFFVGRFIDWTGSYRYLYLWSFFFLGLSLIFMLLLYRKWTRCNV